jgi:hypothetical protein
MVDNEEMMGWQGECRSSVHWLGCRRQKSFCLDSHLFRCAAASVIGTRELNEASKSLRGRCGRAKIHQIPKWQTPLCRPGTSEIMRSTGWFHFVIQGHVSGTADCGINLLCSTILESGIARTISASPAPVSPEADRTD